MKMAAGFTAYPTAQETLQLHLVLCERFGGDPELCDGGLLESALSRPRSSAYATLSEQAAALLQSLALHGPFLEFNGRTALAACAIFLHLNGYRMGLSPDAAEHFLCEQVIARRAGIAQIAAQIELTLTDR